MKYKSSNLIMIALIACLIIIGLSWLMIIYSNVTKDKSIIEAGELVCYYETSLKKVNESYNTCISKGGLISSTCLEHAYSIAGLKYDSTNTLDQFSIIEYKNAKIESQYKLKDGTQYIPSCQRTMVN